MDDIAALSPEASLDGFVSHTGTKHLLGQSSDPFSSYVTAACSSSYLTGTKTLMPKREIDCKKCRKIAGLPDE